MSRKMVPIAVILYKKVKLRVASMSHADKVQLDIYGALAEQDLGPIDVPLVDYGQGHWSTDTAEFPLAGDWQLELLARTSDIDQTRFAVTIPVS